MPDRPTFPKRAVVTAGMPYGNKGLHFGHLAGVFVPADVHARFLRDRIGAGNVLFVCGTDCYGSPIDEGHRKAVAAGEAPGDGTVRDYVRANHDAQKKTLDAYSISLDVYEGSGLGRCGEVHAGVTARLVQSLYDGGWLEERGGLQFFDCEAGAFLNGRQVTGHCPVRGCKSEKAYADECDLGHQFSPAELIAPVSSLSGSVPVLRPVDNWYFRLPDFRDAIAEHTDSLAADETVRPVTTSTIREFLEPPAIFVKTDYLDVYESLAPELPAHRFVPAEKGKASFTLVFDDFEARDRSREMLSAAGVGKFRSGKSLVPFRITGNIEWGVPAPTLEGEEKRCVWCWPESLWAPISFSIAALEARGSTDAGAWREWWCSDEAGVYQFIGQDNLYFYGVAQTGLFEALGSGDDGEWAGLAQTTLVPSYHVLYQGKKASSSGSVTPPSADELLGHYSSEELRAHWAAQAVGVKSASFNPKVFDAGADERQADPVAKEGALLHNIANRIARSCFYTAQKHAGGRAPLGEVSPEVREECERAILSYERYMHRFETWGAMSLLDEFCRGVNKWWSTASREALADDEETAGGTASGGAAGGDAAGGEPAIRQVLVDAFHYLRVMLVLLHPIAPVGTADVFEHLDIRPLDGGCGEPDCGFFSWEHIFCGLDFWATDAERAQGSMSLIELPPRYDFW